LRPLVLLWKDLKEYFSKLRSRAVFERKYGYSEIGNLIHSGNLEINNFDIVTIGQGSYLGRFCALRDYGTGKHPRSISLGPKCLLGPSVTFAVWDNNHITLKGDTSVNDGTIVHGTVTIEKYCLLAPNVFISSGYHHADHIPPLLIKDQDILCFNSEPADDHINDVHIEEDCWIGKGVYLKQGSYIGRGAIIGTNAVVIKDVPPYSIQAGSPNRELKTRLIFQPPDLLCADDVDLRPYFYRGFRHRLDEITESLKRGLILAESHAAITMNKRDCTGLRIKGRLSQWVTSIRVRVRLNGKTVGEAQIANEEFDQELNIPPDDHITDRESITTPSVLQPFNFYVLDCVEIRHKDMQKRNPDTPYGLTSVEQLPR